MPLYRFRTGDGEEHLVDAHRLRMDEFSVYAESCRMGASPPWVVVLRLPLSEIVDVHRRLEVSGGGHAWLDPPVESASGLKYLPNVRFGTGRLPPGDER
ncbi:hypothetical protein [Actinomadura sp. 3N407]|uniref:hypothetical protein n=1 Tax=Actinomadura sp. 3N407 TaxID=3457423 RepID=UPI003FCE4740